MIVGELEPGTVYLVGAGPGDPGLLTVRGRELLDECDAVVYDALAGGAELRTRSDGSSVPEEHNVGKRGGDAASARQEDINRLLVGLARAGKNVVRLKGGDPFVFGRGSEEAQALAEAGVPFEVVPGVTAGIAAPAYAGIPVTHRGLSTAVTFVTGHEDPTKPSAQTNWAALAKVGGTIVLYMGVKRLATIARTLIDAGLPAEMPAAATQWGTMPRQRTVTATLGTLAAAMEREGLGAPVIVTIGWSVVLRDEIAWFDRRPLFGRRVIVTRAADGATALGKRLRARGADVIEAPATRIEPVDTTALDNALGRVRDYGWLVLTSRNAVRAVWESLLRVGVDARALAGVRVAAVGPGTAAALLERGVRVDVLPERFVAEGVLEALAARDDVRGARVLYAAATGARDVLPAGLAALGATVDRVDAYQSVPDERGAAVLRRALEKGVDIVTFASASAVQAFVDAVTPEIAVDARAVTIGPITSEAARAAGIEVVEEADEATVPALADAVVRALLGASSTTGNLRLVRESAADDESAAEE